jgi:hypothetical protein
VRQKETAAQLWDIQKGRKARPNPQSIHLPTLRKKKVTISHQVILPSLLPSSACMCTVEYIGKYSQGGRVVEGREAFPK